MQNIHKDYREANNMLLCQLAGPDMLIDGYDQYNHQQEPEVVNIAPEAAPDGPAEDTLVADDCM